MVLENVLSVLLLVQSSLIQILATEIHFSLGNVMRLLQSYWLTVDLLLETGPWEM
jgi:hypothetical protein